jgi:hypothetical protein
MSKESELYDPFNTKTLGGNLRLDVETYENIQDNIHLERVNRKLLELTDLIGRVTNNRSSSGPITGTMDVFELESSVSGSSVSGFGDGLDSVNPGEIWQIYGFGINPSGVSGSVSYELRIVGISGKIAEISTGSSSLNSAFPLQEDIGPIYIGQGSKIQFEATGTFTTAKFRYCAVRVR